MLHCAPDGGGKRLSETNVVLLQKLPTLLNVRLVERSIAHLARSINDITAGNGTVLEEDLQIFLQGSNLLIACLQLASDLPEVIFNLFLVHFASIAPAAIKFNLDFFISRQWKV
jgi:hypothetical protein